MIDATARGKLASAKDVNDLRSKIKRPDNAIDIEKQDMLDYVRKHVAQAQKLESGGTVNRRDGVLAKGKTLGGYLWTGHFDIEDIIGGDEDLSLVEAYDINGGAADNGENNIAKGLIDAMATGVAQPLRSVGSVPSGGEAFGPVDESDDDKADQKTTSALFKPVSFDGAFDLAASMPRRFVYQNWFALGYLTLIVAPGAAGKSAVLRSIAICIAAGADYLSQDRTKLIKPRAVVVVNGEDDIHDMQKGVEAFLREHVATEEERRHVYANLKLFSSVGADLNGKARFGIASYDKSGAVKISTVERKAIEQFIDDANIEVALFDPLASLHTTSESNEDLDVIARFFADLACRKEIAVGLAHHTTKSSAKTGKVDSLDSRGGGATVNAARISIVLNPLSAEEAARLHIPPARMGRFIAVGLGSKANIAFASGAMLVLEKTSYDAGNARDGYEADSLVVLRRTGEMAAYPADDNDSDDDAGDAAPVPTDVVERLALANETLDGFLSEYLRTYANFTPEADKTREAFSSDVIRAAIPKALDHYAGRPKLPSNAKPKTVKARAEQRRIQMGKALSKMEAAKLVKLLTVPGKGTMVILLN